MYCEDAQIICPYCGEKSWLEIDPSEGMAQEFISDCEVCCRPISYVVNISSSGKVEAMGVKDDSVG